MIKHNEIADGILIMHRYTQKWYVVVDHNLQGAFVMFVQHPPETTPEPKLPLFIWMREYKYYVPAERVRKHNLEKEILEEQELEKMRTNINYDEI